LGSGGAAEVRVRASTGKRVSGVGVLAAALLGPVAAAAAEAHEGAPYPRPLASYPSASGRPLAEVLIERARLEPLALVATVLFVLAIVHTFLAPTFLAASHRAQRRADRARGPGAHSLAAQVLHLLGEIEAVFGIWVVPLLLAIAWVHGVRAPEAFLGTVDFTEPLFVIVIMAIAATRPVLAFAEAVLGRLAALGGSTPAAWWAAALVVGPCLGSVITEPAAMIICALLLSRRVLSREPSRRLRYATLGLLFVNVSVGGTLTDFAAPPVLMVAARWGWNTPFMLIHFGWKAVVGIVVATALYGIAFRRELRALAAQPSALEPEPPEARVVPTWITAVHLALLALTVFSGHTPAFFIGAFLFFLAFQQATAPYQQPLELRAPILVGFFLAGLVVHGAGQQWWIGPVLSGLAPGPLFFGAAGLTAFNDNAAITYLASLVPGFGAAAKYAVLAGAVAGGGLTVIANAPNPAGQSVLSRHFPDGVAPLSLLAGALPATAVMVAVLLLLP
jgi:hypothetical protein